MFCLHEFPGRVTRTEPLLPTKGLKVEAGVGTYRRAWEKATFSQAKIRNPEVSIFVKEAQSTMVRTRGARMKRKPGLDCDPEQSLVPYRLLD